MLKVGILGTGFGHTHAKFWSSLADVEVLGIFGRNHKKLQNIHKELGIPIYTDITALIAHPQIDLIDVVLPTALHKKYVIQVLQANKHVFCETPLTYTLQDAQEIQQVAHKMQKEVFVGLFMLFSPEFRYVLDQSPSTSFGALHAVWLSRRTPRIWGDMTPMILNLMIHDFDYLYALLGEPTTITARQVFVPEVKGEHIYVNLHYESCEAVIEGSCMLPKSYPFSLTLQALGTHEAIEIHYPVNGNFETCHVVHYPQEGEKYEPQIEYANEYRQELVYVRDFLNGKNTTRINQIEIAIKSLKMALMAKQSYEKGGIPIEWNDN